VVAEPDWETLMVNAANRSLSRRILNFQTDRMRNGWMARQLPGLFAASGLVEIRIEPFTGMLFDLALASQVFQLESAAAGAVDVGVISAAEAGLWLADLRQKEADRTFFSALTGLIVSAHKG
jgi:hypothetical protein